MSFDIEKFDRNKLKDRTYTADEYEIDPELNEYLFEGRKCTDVFWCILFTSFVGLMFFVMGYSMTVGDYNKLLAPIVVGNHICGYSPGLESYPYFYIPDIKNALSDPTNLFMYGVCVESCPVDKDSKFSCADTSYYSRQTCDDFPRYATT